MHTLIEEQAPEPTLTDTLLGQASSDHNSGAIEFDSNSGGTGKDD